jgi:hypothetical protein
MRMTNERSVKRAPFARGQETFDVRLFGDSRHRIAWTSFAVPEAACPQETMRQDSALQILALLAGFREECRQSADQGVNIDPMHWHRRDPGLISPR